MWAHKGRHARTDAASCRYNDRSTRSILCRSRRHARRCDRGWQPGPVDVESGGGARAPARAAPQRSQSRLPPHLRATARPGGAERARGEPCDARPTQPLPCWKSTPFDPLPAATCETMRAQLLHRWRRLASPRCAVLKDTTPRALASFRARLHQQSGGAAAALTLQRPGPSNCLRAVSEHTPRAKTMQRDPGRYLVPGRRALPTFQIGMRGWPQAGELSGRWRCSEQRANSELPHSHRR